MSKRLTELKRQRALLQEHLAWLDREIAVEQQDAGAPAVPSPATPAKPPVPTPATPAPGAQPPPAADVAPEIDQIFATHEQAPGSLQHDARRGCWQAFWILMLGTLLIVGIAYALYARHIGRWW